MFQEFDYSIIWEGEGLDEKGIDKKTGKTLIEISPDYYRPSDVDFLLGDASKAKKDFGWKPKVSFKELIKINTRQSRYFWMSVNQTM